MHCSVVCFKFYDHVTPLWQIILLPILYLNYFSCSGLIYFRRHSNCLDGLGGVGVQNLASSIDFRVAGQLADVPTRRMVNSPKVKSSRRKVEPHSCHCLHADDRLCCDRFPTTSKTRVWCTRRGNSRKFASIVGVCDCLVGELTNINIGMHCVTRIRLRLAYLHILLEEYRLRNSKIWCFNVIEITFYVITVAICFNIAFIS